MGELHVQKANSSLRSLPTAKYHLKYLFPESLTMVPRNMSFIVLRHPHTNHLIFMLLFFPLSSGHWIRYMCNVILLLSCRNCLAILSHILPTSLLLAEQQLCKVAQAKAVQALHSKVLEWWLLLSCSLIFIHQQKMELRVFNISFVYYFV